MQKIIIFLIKSDLSQIAWSIVNEDGGITNSNAQGTLEELALVEKKPEYEVSVIAAPEDVLLTVTKLPKLTRQRLLQALPFALEEQLLSDVNELHFAMGEYHEDNVAVAVISKQKIESWLNTLKSVGLTPISLIPAPLALPYVENTWHIKLLGDTAIVRTGMYSGFSCDKHNLATLLELKMAEQTSIPKIVCDNYSGENFSFAGECAQHDYAPKQFILSLLEACAQSPINLLQGQYRPRRKMAFTQKIWRYAAITTAVWLALLFLGNLVSFFILHHETAKLETAINSIYKKNFPQATSVVAPKERMSEKLANLQNQNHKNRLLIWLAQIGLSLREIQNIHIDALDFRNNQLSITLSAPDIDKVDSLAERLGQQGLSVKPQNIAANGAKVSGILIISEGNL